MLITGNYIKSFSHSFPKQHNLFPWEITGNLTPMLASLMRRLDDDYEMKDGVAIHHTATIEPGAILKDAVIVGAHCFIGSNAYLRGGVYLDSHVKVGTGCEIKTSMIFSNSTIAHFNFIGDSLIGSFVNFEAGSITANHYNERAEKSISVVYMEQVVKTGVNKFGALVGDHSKIGANAVLSPGTILEPGSVVKRLELIDQLAERIYNK